MPSSLFKLLSQRERARERRNASGEIISVDRQSGAVTRAREPVDKHKVEGEGTSRNFRVKRLRSVIRSARGVPVFEKFNAAAVCTPVALGVLIRCFSLRLAVHSACGTGGRVPKLNSLRFAPLPARARSPPTRPFVSTCTLEASLAGRPLSGGPSGYIPARLARPQLSGVPTFSQSRRGALSRGLFRVARVRCYFGNFQNKRIRCRFQCRFAV